jgi:hypothetical protein
MTTFMAIKIHYDHRKSLPIQSKYSRTPTFDEYQEYLRLYKSEGIGGYGFHECLNYKIPERGAVQIYLPPKYIPHKRHWHDDLVIFSFTYRRDREKPACVVGVHAGAHILSKDGIIRPDDQQLDNVAPLTFHAEAPADFVTLFVAPLPYNVQDGRYMPKVLTWGNGLRYIKKQHAERIIDDSLMLAQGKLSNTGASLSELEFLKRQIAVLKNIKSRYVC